MFMTVFWLCDPKCSHCTHTAVLREPNYGMNCIGAYAPTQAPAPHSLPGHLPLTNALLLPLGMMEIEVYRDIPQQRPLVDFNAAADLYCSTNLSLTSSDSVIHSDNPASHVDLFTLAMQDYKVQ